MMRSLYSAISGLKNHQVKMDVIGNNIANVNTAGFKRSRVSFSTMLSQTMKGASAATSNNGGTNAIQVGMGSNLSSIDQIMTQGSSQTTGRETDLMIQGNGFFVINRGGQTLYTRAGGFGFDSDGNLEDPASGARVQGYTWGADDTATPVFNNSSPQYGGIKFALNDKIPLLTTLNGSETNWLHDDNGTVGNTADDTHVFQSNSLVGAQNLKVYTDPPANTTLHPSYTFDPNKGTITFAGAQPANLGLVYDTGMLLSSFSIDQNGVVTGVYSDGNYSTTHKIAQISIATFSNEAGLVSSGSNFFSESPNSGKPAIGAAGADTTIIPSAVEMSNVDLSQEFTDMIVTQRGFQANSRVITVSDSLLQELIDLKRQ